MELKSKSKKLGIIYGQNDESEVWNSLPYGDTSINKGTEKCFKG